jgi:type VI protein secretion system component VasK
MPVPVGVTMVLFLSKIASGAAMHLSKHFLTYIVVIGIIAVSGFTWHTASEAAVITLKAYWYLIALLFALLTIWAFIKLYYVAKRERVALGRLEAAAADELKARKKRGKLKTTPRRHKRNMPDDTPL